MTDPLKESRPIPDGLVDTELDNRLSILRGFTVAEHLDDRSLAALMELNRGGIGEPTN